MPALSFDEALHVAGAVHKYSDDEARDDHGRWVTGMTGDSADGKEIAHLDSHELFALTDYQGDGFEAVNRYLTGQARDAYPDHLAVMKKQVGLLDSAMSRSTITKPMTLYRGINDNREQFTSDKNVGKTLNYKMFLSTSKDEGVADKMAGMANDTPDHTAEMVMRIKVPAGTHAIDMARATGYFSNEQEVLLDRGQKLRIDSIDHAHHIVEATLL